MDDNKITNVAIGELASRQGAPVGAPKNLSLLFAVMVGLVSALFSTAIGLVVGSVAGYFRRLDFVIMRVVDVIMSFPLWILLLLA